MGKHTPIIFPQVIFQQIIEQPFHLLEINNQFDVLVNIRGGGVKGQAEAIRLGISRALVVLNAENKPKLKAAKMLTPRPTRRGTQEARPRQSAQAFPIQQTLIVFFST